MTSSPLCLVRNPYNGAELGQLPYASDEDIRNALQKGTRAFSVWRASTSHQRSQLLLAVAARLESRRQEFALLIRDEAGKPIASAEGEVLRALGVLRWAAAEAVRFSGELLRTDVTGSGRAGFGIHTRFPRGLVLGITPFNFPLNLLIHKIAPAIACGCSILIKPSPATPLTAARLIEIFQEVGAPDGLVQRVMADDEQTAALTRAPEISLVSFTGSDRVGKLIRAQAVDKPVALELGGNAWVIVMEDMPESVLPAIAKKIAGAAFGYAGQSCISVQNVTASASFAPVLGKALAEAVQKTAYGDPADANVISGPVINAAAAQRISAELSRVTGNKISSNQLRKGAAESPLVLAPTLVTFDDFPENSTLISEEIFGPVMTLTRFQDLPEIVRRINSSRYGLQAGVFTNHWPTIETLYRELEVGGLVVNDVPTTRYDHQPYGGVKDSGLGREGVRYAMEEMTESKFLALSSELPKI